jgi:hypothetical protein
MTTFQTNVRLKSLGHVRTKQKFHALRATRRRYGRLHATSEFLKISIQSGYISCVIIFLWHTLERRSRQTQRGKEEKYVRWQKGRAETKIIIRQCWTFSPNNIYFYETLKLELSVGDSNKTIDLKSSMFRAMPHIYSNKYTIPSFPAHKTHFSPKNVI